MIDKPSEGLDKRFLLFYFCITDIKNGNNNKNKLTMKTKLITLTVLLLSAFAMKAQEGEIIYTEFNPPLLIQGDDIGGGNHQEKIRIDLDGNGEIDYEISFGFGKSEYYLYQVGYSDTKFREVGLWESDTIVPYDGSWANVPMFGYWTDWSEIGSDDLTGDYYDKVGFYKVINGKKYYGWIHRYGHEDFSYPFFKWVAVDKIAFCTIPDYPLLWGQTDIVGIVETIENGFSVYPNPANGVLFVETRHGTSLPDPIYRITNIMGQTVLSGNIAAETHQINIASLPAGLYFISVGDMTQKFVVK